MLRAALCRSASRLATRFLRSNSLLSGCANTGVMAQGLDCCAWLGRHRSNDGGARPIQRGVVG